jgi:eukaryotic-like serine/threonine-protein kinase
MSASRLTLIKTTTSSEVRLVEVLDAYMAAAQEGRAPSRDELLADHPELADDLEACLASLEFIRQASLTAPPLVADSKSVEASEGEAGIGDLGDFRLVAEIGRGGMGVVYEAVQRSLNRRVALKVLPFAAAMDPTQLRRFQTEALAAAQLHHTHIVPVYSVGCERGVHFYAMQFIEGQTLAQAIAERRRLESGSPSPLVGEGGPQGRMGGERVGEGGPKGRMGGDRDRPRPGSTKKENRRETDAIRSNTATPSSRTREYFRTAAGLGIQAAEALDHAHKVGIVHRDIKPANLLLDVQGNLWVTDFGLARLQDDAGLTITGDLLGTLRYMSPEQALAKRGYLDHRTDIYSLGATLYELVTLWPAIDGHDRHEVLRKIAQDEPTLPRRLNPAIPRELETILLKAMNKEPESRYATAQELADDLRRYLDNKPIKAKPPTVWEHAVKWSRRHTAIVGAALAILAVAVLALLVNSILLGREQRRTVAALKLAESRSRQARKAVDSMYTRVAEKWLFDQPGLTPLQREFLQEALAFYQEFARQQSEDPEAQIEAAVALRRVGDIDEELSNHEETERTYLQAIEILNDLVDRPHDNPRRREELSAVQLKLARLYHIDGRNPEAADRFTQALEIYQALAIQHPDRFEYQVGQARCLLGLGSTRWATGRSNEAERFYLRARQIFEPLAKRPEARTQTTEGLRGVNHNLGALYGGARRYSEAEHCWRRAVELSAQALRGSPMSPKQRHDHASDVGALAGALADQAKWLEAEKTLREAIRIQEPLAAELPERTEFREDLAASLNLLGRLLHHLGQSTEEEEVLRRSIGILKELVSATPRLIFRRVIIALALIRLATLERDMGHFDASERLLADARSHIRIGLEINPTDPNLKELNVEIESFAKGKATTNTAGVRP